MQWTDETVSEARRRLDDENNLLAGVRAVMTYTVGVVQSLGGTMTAEKLEAARYAVSSGDSLEADFTDHWGGKVFEHISAQGATVATLQVKVAELEQHAKELDSTCVMLHGERDAARAEVDGLRKEVSGLMGERETWRAEVERLKAEAKMAQERARHFERVAHGADKNWMLACRHAETAESRLAAIRERGSDDVGLVRAANLPGHPPALLVGRAVAAWILEGDAPQEAKGPEDLTRWEAESVERDLQNTTLQARIAELERLLGSMNANYREAADRASLAEAKLTGLRQAIDDALKRWSE